ncbi:MAG: hypothetical protein KAU16_05765 [Methanophagales archaeon]|nr:hypothetical protein [Methanophagales archaeon]
MATKKPMKRTPQEWRNIYKGRYHTYEDFTNKLQNLISVLLQEHKVDAQIESRTKSIESFVEKIQREGKNYHSPLEEITDLVGIRIIAYYKEDVDKIGEIIKTEFDVDWKNSIDKVQTLDPDRFGYLSVHYVISLPSPRKELTEWNAFANIKAEIQVRTVLQHAWAAINHKLIYKTAKEVPKNLRRQLFRLSALLELADEEFSNLRKRTKEVEEHYSQELKKGKLDIELDLSSLDVYIESTKQDLKWMKIAEEVGYSRFQDKLPEIEEDRLQSAKSVLLTNLWSIGIKTINELDEILESASKWGEAVLARFSKMLSDEGITLQANPYEVILFIVLYARGEVVTDEFLKQTGIRADVLAAIREVIRTK